MGVAITHRHGQTDTDVHSHPDKNLHTQTLNKFCKSDVNMKQTHRMTDRHTESPGN